jgi:hypothetical protein
VNITLDCEIASCRCTGVAAVGRADPEGDHPERGRWTDTPPQRHAWDFAGPDDVLTSGDLASVGFSNGDMTGTTVGNDSFVELPLRSETNPDRYHRATVDMCLDGGMSFANAPAAG